MRTLVNLGCGECVHPDWINIDLIARQPGVLAYDLTAGIPVPSNSADAVYNAAVLEHLRRQDVGPFLKEIYRILKPGGVVRIGVPDLEQICRIYLEKLQSALAGNSQAMKDYEWIMLEMFDQMVRERSGGAMAAYLRRDPLSNESFVLERIGTEARKLINSNRAEKNRDRPTREQGRIRKLARRLAGRMAGFLVGRNTTNALSIGRFRLSGEVHHWMYDRFSLARELKAAGFHDPNVQAGSESSIPGWENFYLDIQPDGAVIKPDLFFMEASKPGHGNDQ